jgi:hypothetical protein
MITVGAALALTALLPVSAQAAGSGAAAYRSANPVVGGYDEPLCQSRAAMCVDLANNPPGEYVGHDEPSLEFKSGIPGSGNDVTYTMTLPKDPTTEPNNTGDGGTTWNFELRATFWFGLTMCDTQSAPNFNNSCKPDSDANNLVGSNPKARDYIGKHPGNAYMELQFYAPGWVEQFAGIGCTATQYCAAMTIDSASENQNTGAVNTSACDNYILGGVEPVNWAYVTTSGVSQAPANPLFTGTFANPNFSAVNPDPTKDLMMNPGDVIQIHMHDTTAGFRVDLTDEATGQSGSMTASKANGFGHVLFTPKSRTCKEVSYAFHPEYSTANPRGNTWSAHTYNVAESDEIGHFENCQNVDLTTFNCTSPGAQDSAGLDADDTVGACLPGILATVAKINGCVGIDSDFDGQPYQNVWPGTVVGDASVRPTPLMFTSPLANGNQQYSTIAFETDLPRIEAADTQANPPFCDRMTGANCVNPPAGAQFYPFFSTTTTSTGACVWQEGGNFLPNTVDNFGGSSTTEFGPLFPALYPGPGPTPLTMIDNFNSGDQTNPCPVGS